jgi:NADH:ubiquinone oxidoreductase subunit E
MPDKKVGAALVVGGGIAGMQASLDLAESGFKVYLVDKNPSIGGVMAQLDKTFPTNDCAMCTLAPRMVDCGRRINIEKLTYSEVAGIQGTPGKFHVQVRKKARSVDPAKCTGCGECTQNCLVRYKVYPQPEEIIEPELEPQERSKVEDIVSRHKNKRAPLIGVLQDVNEEFNYLPAPVLRYLSHHLDVPLAHVLKVSTFYSLFSLKPRGKHVITVCQGTTCFVRGAERIMAELEGILGIKPGDMTEDGKFSLETVRCIGCCALAPCVRIDRDVHAKVRPTGMGNILGRY